MDNILQQQLRDAGYKGEFDLPSLVAACGNDFYQLEQYQGNGEWVARAYVDGKIISSKFDVHSINDPDIVVAVLWLMLQKKNPA